MDLPFPLMASIRLGFGLSPLMPPPQTPDDVLSSVAPACDPAPGARTMPAILAQRDRFVELNRARKAGDAAAGREYQALQRDMAGEPRNHLQRRLARAVEAPSGFGERLVQFWADHFTIRADGALQQTLGTAFVDQAIRPHLNGSFADLLIAADTHPMMLSYLNQNQSFGPNSRNAVRNPQRKLGLNENLAREMIELHSLGVRADYSQQDVRELAELLTGLNWRRKGNRRFFPAMAEPGAETVLGRSYGGDGPANMRDIHAVMTDLARHPATARHLSRKLVVHFVSDSAPEGMVRDLAKVWRDSEGDLPSVYRALVEHADLAQHFGTKARQPFDYLAAASRALGLSGADIRALSDQQMRRFYQNPMARMGQQWTRPLGPDGWPEAAAEWITPQGLAARIEWSLQVPRRLVDQLPDPRDLLQTALADAAGANLQWAVPKAETAAEGVALVLASAEFNRR